MGSPGHTPLTDDLIERIARAGPLTFAAFMEACLYHPEHGYYTRRVPAPGPRDYVTSPEVGPLFARLLAWQLGEMWELLGRPGRFDLVEGGAGRGALAAGRVGGAGGPAGALRSGRVRRRPRRAGGGDLGGGSREGARLCRRAAGDAGRSEPAVAGAGAGVAQDTR